MKILIIDDDPIARMLIKKKIEKDNFLTNPYLFSNGLEAYQYLLECFCPNEELIIFLDLNMPIMDGWEFLEKINSYTLKFNNIKIFIITSSTDKNEIIKAKSFKKVTLFLSKPILNNELALIKNEILKDKLHNNKFSA